MTIAQKVTNLYALLKSTDEDEIIIRTTYVPGGWHDVEFTAEVAGFKVSRFFNPEYEKRHEFSECYMFMRARKAR